MTEDLYRSQKPSLPAGRSLGSLPEDLVASQGQRGLQPLVSVVTPAYNEELHLSECIESILSQTYANFECIIVNNCSTDGTLAIAQKYADRDPRIRVTTNRQFLPAVENFNGALRQISASSQYCKMVLADDWLFPECLERMVTLMEDHPSVGVVGGYGLHGRWILWSGLPYPSTVIPGRKMGRERLLGGPYIFGSQTSVMFRSELVRQHNPFFNASSDHPDSEACLSLLRECDFGFVHQVLTFSRQREGSLLSRAQRLNTLAVALLRELIVYGPHYLSQDEFLQRVEIALSEYYEFLARSWLHRRDSEFWSYHERALAELGSPLSRGRLARSLLKLAAKSLRNRMRTPRNNPAWGLHESAVSTACK